MTVYVDDHYRYSTSEFRGMRMSHMIADTDEELEAMARKLNLRPEWKHDDHYDVSHSKRLEARKLGALYIDVKSCAIMSGNKRAGWPMGDQVSSRVIFNLRLALAKATR